MLSITLKELLRLDKEIEEKEKELKALNSEKNKKTAEAVTEMDSEGVTELSIDGIKFKRDVITNFSIESHDWSDERFFKFLEDVGSADIIKVRKDVNANTRKAFLKEYLEEHNALPEFIQTSYMDTVVMRKDRRS